MLPFSCRVVPTCVDPRGHLFLDGRDVRPPQISLPRGQRDGAVRGLGLGLSFCISKPSGARESIGEVGLGGQSSTLASNRVTFLLPQMDSWICWAEVSGDGRTLSGPESTPLLISCSTS